MDDLTYNYNRDANGHLLNNKLDHINDAIPFYADNNTHDLHDQSPGNYRYDAIGNLVVDQQSNISNINWSVYGKIQSISKTDGSDFTYTYYPDQKRATQLWNGITTFYVRDAQGNTLAIYDNKGGTVNWKEQDLYGSSRLGMWTPNVNLANNNAQTIWDTIGHKTYELTNHLGNVLATITDKRIPYSPDGTTIAYYQPEVTTAQEYFAFGFAIPSRNYTLGQPYRYGFNGKENDNQVKLDFDGKGIPGSQQDYGNRIYDPRVGRFLSVDPIGKNYPELTSYQFASNSPIENIDIDGLEKYSIHYMIKNGLYVILKVETDYSLKYLATPSIGSVPTLKPKVAEFILEDKGGKVISKSGDIPLKNLGSTLYVGPWNPKYSNGKDRYDLPAVNSLDLAGKHHDLKYDKLKAAGPADAITDVATIEADKGLVSDSFDVMTMYLRGGIHPVNHKKVSRETYDTAVKVFKAFSAIVIEKAVRIKASEVSESAKDQWDNIIQQTKQGLRNIDNWTPMPAH